MLLRYLVGSLMVVGLLGACATPKTPEEFRQSTRSQGAYTKLETFAVQRPYAAVVKDIKTHSEFCLRKTFYHSQKQASLLPTKEQDMGTTNYVPLAKIGPSKAEFCTKWVNNRKGEDGSDQFIFYVADVSAKGSNATSIDLYYYTHERYGWPRDLVKAWARGEDPSCPKLTGWY